MNALTKIEADPFEVWLQVGHALLVERRELDWRLSDHLATGLQKFPEQIQLPLISEQWGAEPKMLKGAIKAAEAFPPALRAPNVSFEVHRYIAALPAKHRLETLQRASREHWGVKQATAALTKARAEQAVFQDDDPERLATHIYRAWNNASVDVREIAWERIRHSAANGFRIIDEEVLIDA